MTDQVQSGSVGNTNAHWPEVVQSPLFALIDLTCAVVAAALWYVSRGELGWLPILLALAPWAARVVAGYFPFRRTRLDALLLLFLVSAVVAAAVAPIPETAWPKFWLLVGALFLFYALAGQPAEHIWPIVLGLGLFGALVALYFMLTHNWAELPAKIESLNQVALRWSALRPVFLASAHALHPNVAGGLMAMMAPFLIAAGGRAAHKQQWLTVVVVAAASLLLITGLIFTTSRGAWVALSGGLAGWLLWRAARPLGHRLYLSRRKALALELLVVLGVGLTVVLLLPGGPLALFNRLPGPDSTSSRLEISQQAVDLMTDFPWTGAGLGSFDGLYSTYIRVIPQHYLIHSHNLFLDVGAEQGLFGLLLLVTTLACCFWWLSDPYHSQPDKHVPSLQLVSGALISSLTVLSLHGLVEDPLYGSRALLLLLVPVALVAVVFPRRPASAPEDNQEAKRRFLLGGVAFVTMAAVAGLLFRQPLVSSAYSNWGALQMARTQLSGYPTNEWPTLVNEAAYEGASYQFRAALQANSRNRTAWYRLGMLAMLDRDFRTATANLEQALELDPAHRGIGKSLGYSYLWSGNQARAAAYLLPLPETLAELDAYAWWWIDQGRPDLAQIAADARAEWASTTSP